MRFYPGSARSFKDDPFLTIEVLKFSEVMFCLDQNLFTNTFCSKIGESGGRYGHLLNVRARLQNSRIFCERERRSIF